MWAAAGVVVMGDAPIWTSLPLCCVLAWLLPHECGRSAYLGENVVSENEYLSAIVPVGGAQDAVAGGRVVFVRSVCLGIWRSVGAAGRYSELGVVRSERCQATLQVRRRRDLAAQPSLELGPTRRATRLLIRPAADLLWTLAVSTAGPTLTSAQRKLPSELKNADGTGTSIWTCRHLQILSSVWQLLSQCRRARLPFRQRLQR
jgi:hypothetical protein